MCGSSAALAPGDASAGPHVKARSQDNPNYPQRFPVPDDKVPWSVPWHEYAPIEFVKTSKGSDGKELWFVDPEDPNTIHDSTKGGPRFNASKRKSYTVDYLIDPNGRPLNPNGRTGISNRGTLDVWGPAFAADPVVTRRDPATGRLQVVVIQRRDTGHWALPGGFTDFNEPVSKTARREYSEEAANLEGEERARFEALTEQLFNNGREVYRGYVDDPRTTDNSWIETVVFHYHCKPEIGDKLSLRAGDDAGRAKWLDIGEDSEYVNLWASHKKFVDLALRDCLSP